MLQYGSKPLFEPDNIYFIGDIHGDFPRLQRLWVKISAEWKENDHAVFLGDLVNRLGLYSAEVLEFIRDLKIAHPGRVHVIEGNHDWMLKNYLATGNMGWMSQYGKNTIQSFVRKYNLPENHEEFLDELEANGVLAMLNEMIPYYETEKVIATHAPLDWTVSMMHGLDDYEEYMQDEEIPFKRHLLDRMLYDIQWGFTAEDKKIKEIPKFLVCGHQFKHHKQPRIFKDRMFVDVGCGARENRPLVAVSFPGKQILRSDD